ncbi:hypothetical protein BH09ACT7_BH09ACT7_31820 [soil metagenome]
MRNLDRRWIAAICVLLLVGGVLLWQTVFNKPSEECKPVRDILDFNQSQAEIINKKTGDGAPPIADYQLWADGLTQRAEKVSDPNLAATAIKLADLATDFVVKLSRLPSEPTGEKAPPVAYEMSALNDQITANIKELSDACPA